MGKKTRMTKESEAVDTCMEMRKEIHDMRQTHREREQEMFIFSTGWYREKRNVIALCSRPERRRVFGL